VPAPAEPHDQWLLRGVAAQTDVLWLLVYDPVADYYYWFTTDVVIVDFTWVPYVP
jgi:hypothetical protein